MLRARGWRGAGCQQERDQRGARERGCVFERDRRRVEGPQDSCDAAGGEVAERLGRAEQPKGGPTNVGSGVDGDCRVLGRLGASDGDAGQDEASAQSGQVGAGDGQAGVPEAELLLRLLGCELSP